MAWVWGAAGFPILLPVGQPGPPVPGHTVVRTEAVPRREDYLPWDRQSPKNGGGSSGVTHALVLLRNCSPSQGVEWGQSTGCPPMGRQEPEELSMRRGAGKDFLLVEGREPGQGRGKGIERRGRWEGTSVPGKVVGKGVGWGGAMGLEREAVGIRQPPSGGLMVRLMPRSCVGVWASRAVLSTGGLLSGCRSRSPTHSPPASA